MQDSRAHSCHQPIGVLWTGNNHNGRCNTAIKGLRRLSIEFNSSLLCQILILDLMHDLPQRRPSPSGSLAYRMLEADVDHDLCDFD